MENPMEKESTLGQMGRCMKVSGSTGLKRARGFGKEYLATLTLENGDSQKQLAMACINGRMETSTKESGSTA